MDEGDEINNTKEQKTEVGLLKQVKKWQYSSYKE